MARRRRSRTFNNLGDVTPDPYAFAMPPDTSGGYVDASGNFIDASGMNWGPIDTGATPLPAANTGLLASFQQKFSDAVAQLDAQSAALDQAENDLYAVQLQASKDPADYAEWQNQFAKVNAAISTRDAAKNAVATASSWWNSAKSALGLAGLRPSHALGALGFLPEIPWATIALITGGAAAIAAVIAAVNSFVDKMNLKAWNEENIRRSQAGEAPLPDSSRPAPLSNPSIFSGVTDLSKVIVFGLIAVFVLPVILKRI
jgi:hypothetical protein